MKKETKTTLIFLLAVPLLLGAVASEQPGIKHDVAPSLDTMKTESGVQVELMPTARPTTLEAPTLDVSAPVHEATAAATYSIDWYSINGGGTVNATSPSYQMGASIGQSVAGAASSPSYQMGIGFWYGASGGGCACDCHADPGNCDGVQTVLDVVQSVNVAFRNAAAIPDPNGSCPYQTTDVSCDNITTVIDVVKMVNVTFRNGNPATEFCNPCP